MREVGQASESRTTIELAEMTAGEALQRLDVAIDCAKQLDVIIWRGGEVVSANGETSARALLLKLARNAHTVGERIVIEARPKDLDVDRATREWRARRDWRSPLILAQNT